MKQASMVPADRYNFSVYLANGQKKPDVARFFLVRRPVTYIDLRFEYLMHEDGTRWELYCEPEVIDSFRQYDALNVACILSFQVFRNGEQIAVARLLSEEKNRKQTKGKKEHA